MNIRNVSVKDLQQAAQIKARIDRLQAQLEGIFKENSAAPARRSSRAKKAGKNKSMSEEAKAKISATQRKRWQERKAAERNKK
jgi:hypothetical protein